MDYQATAEIIDGYQVARKKTIENIKQLLKDTCDKQKEICIENMSDLLAVSDYQKVRTAPYPTSLL